MGRKSFFLLFLFLIIVGFIFISSCKTETNGDDDNNDGNDDNQKIYTLQERLDSHKFPKLANQLQTYIAEQPVFSNVYFWDLLIVDVEIVANNSEYLGDTGKFRTDNPYVVILGYFSPIDVIPGNTSTINGGFIDNLKDGWYMKDILGNHYKLFNVGTTWTEMLNLTTDVNSFIPQYLKENVVSKNLLDGIFYDWINTDWDWLNYRDDTPSEKPDVDNDGNPESDDKINNLINNGIKEMLNDSRNTYPSGTIIMGNGGWITGTAHDKYLNGVMIEGFVSGESVSEDTFGWGAVMRSYYLHLKNCKTPNLSFIMANGKKGNYRFQRFALASALMFDGYFAYTNDNGAYLTDWWYDEYSVDIDTGESKKSLDYKGYLGNPTSFAYNIDNKNQKLETILNNNYLNAKNYVWRRDFENGIVIVNPSDSEKTISLERTFKKIKGQYDKSVNDGSSTDKITLKSKSGIILLK